MKNLKTRLLELERPQGGNETVKTKYVWLPQGATDQEIEAATKAAQLSPGERPVPVSWRETT